MGKTRVPVEIDGMKFNILGDEDERYIKYIASYVDRAISDINSSYPENNRIENLILTIVNLKDKIEKEKEEFKGSPEYEKINEYQNLEIRLKKSEEEIERLSITLKNKNDLIETFKLKEATYAEKDLENRVLKNKLEENLEEISGLNDTIKDKEDLINKYKERDIFASNKLKEESKKVKDTYAQYKKKSEEIEKLSKENKRLEDLVEELDGELSDRDLKISELEERISSLEEGFNSI